MVTGSRLTFFGKNTHQQVKAKILERLGEWTEMFSKDPDLGIMAQAYNKLKSQSKSIRSRYQNHIDPFRSH